MCLRTSALRRDDPAAPESLADNDNLGRETDPAARATAIADRFRSLSISLLAATCLTAAGLAFALKVRVDPKGTAVVLWAIAAMLLVSRMWWDRIGKHALADAAGTIGVVSLGAMSGGAIAMLGLRFGFPTADEMLLQADLALGIDGLQVATMVAGKRDLLLPILAPIYNFAVELCFASLVILSLMNDRVEAWRGALIFVGTLLTTCSVAAFIPATGLINWATPDVLAYLPSAFMSHFNEFYRGPDPVLRLQVIDGIVSFPSFHAIVGFLVLSMWRKRLATLIPAAIWLAVELLSTVAAGHYVVDLLGGLLVWAGWFALTCWIERRVELKGQGGERAFP